MSYIFELKEVCFGENELLDKKTTDKLIKEILKAGFFASDNEDCNKDEIKLCLHHLDGEDGEDLGYYWLKFKIKER